jgi:hypothetical protein
MILDTVASSNFSYAAGVSGNVTVPAGLSVRAFWCVGGSGGGTLVITPGGANQVATAGATITIPAGISFGELMLTELGPGTVFVFTGTSSYFVQYTKAHG